MGVNDAAIAREHRMVSNASSTVHCLTPILVILEAAFGIRRALFTTIHSYTSAHRLADVPAEDKRRGRAAAENIIPQASRSPAMVLDLLPALSGKLTGYAMNVPVSNGSVVDLVVWHEKPVTPAAINEAVRAAAGARALEGRPRLRRRADRLLRRRALAVLGHVRLAGHDDARPERLEDAVLVRLRLRLRPPRRGPRRPLRGAGEGMTAVRVGINGFGRIGRSVFRILSDRADVEVAVINDLFDNDHLAYLLKYDTVMRVFPKDVTTDAESMTVAGRRVAMTSEKDPARIPWGTHRVDVVVESTGRLLTREALEKHLAAGARRVILTVPAKDEIDATIVMGVNDDTLVPEHRIVSNASCTTNCLAPIAKILDESFGIEEGFMTTVHAYTNDQRLADVPHKDLRRSRAAAENIIPTTTGAARAVGKVLPRLKGRLDGMAIRVPVPDGSIVDLTCRMARPVSAEEVNAAVRAAAEGPLRRIVEYSEVPLVSSDIIGNPALLDLRRALDAGRGRRIPQGPRLVRQRVGVLEPRRGPRRPACVAVAPPAARSCSSSRRPPAPRTSRRGV